MLGNFEFKRGVSRNVVAQAPDGGWGWLVVLASFLLQAVTVGITYTFGVIYVDLMEYFSQTESATAWIGSIQPALLYFTGVGTGPLLKRFGWRAVVISGSAISSAGMCLSYFATNIYILYFTYGAMTGVGFGMMYVTSMVTVQHYFDKRRAMATGIAVSGSGMGTLCFGLFTQFLLDTFRWRLTLVIEGGVTLVIGVFSAALFRPIEIRPNTETDPLLAANKANPGHKDSYKTFQDEGSCETAGPSKVPTSDSVFTTPERSLTSSSISEQTTSPGSDTKHDKFQNDSIVKQLEFRRGSGLPDIIEDIPKNVDSPDVSNGCCPRLDCRAACLRCDDKFRLSLCKNPRLFMYCLSVFLFCIGYHVPFAFTPAKAIAHGLSAHKASLLVSSMGISNVVFRLVFGWIGDKSAALRFVVLGSVLILCGVDSIISFLYTTFPLLLVYSSLFGAFSGCFASLYPVVMVDLMGLDVIGYTVGLGMAASSIAFLLASPVAGWVIQHAGGYNTAFGLVGGFQVFGGLLFFCILLLPRRFYPPSPSSREGTPQRNRTFCSESIA